MKSKFKRVKISAKRVVPASVQVVVPLKDRRLTFGGKWDYAPAPEDSKNYVIAPRHELFIDGKFVAPASGKYFPSINPATEQHAHGNCVGERAGRGLGGGRGAARLRKRLEQNAGTRAGQISLPHRAHHPGKVARTGRAGNDGRRQDHQGKPRRGFAARGRAFFLSRGLGGQIEIRVSRQNAAAARRGRADHPVEFSAAHGGVENRPRTGLRQHGGFKTGGNNEPSPRCGWRRFSRKRNCRTAWSTSSPARAKPARRS